MTLTFRGLLLFLHYITSFRLKSPNKVMKNNIIVNHYRYHDVGTSQMAAIVWDLRICVCYEYREHQTMNVSKWNGGL